MKKIFIPMKKLLIVLVTSLIIPLFFSCNGEEDYEDLEFYPYALHGYVKDYHTGKPLANVTFDLSCGQYFVGMQAQTKRYYYEGVAKTDSRGYYKIRIPKGNKDMDFSVVFPHPQNISGYNFEGGEFDCKQFASTSVRADITAISYGYLKVIMLKDCSANLSQAVGDYYTPIFINQKLGCYNIDTSKVECWYKVPVAREGIHYILNGNANVIMFNIEQPRDTVAINVEE